MQWGVLEFITLLAIVAAVSYIGIRVLSSNFTRNKVTGKIKTSLGGDDKKLFKTVMGVIDSAATENDEKIEEEEYANEDISEIIRQYIEEKMNEAGLELDKHPNLVKFVVKKRQR